MSGLGSSPLASVDDVDPHKSPQSLDEHQFVHAELVEPDPDPDPVPDSKAAPAATKSKRNIILASGAVLLLFVAAAVVGGVCGTGMCSSDKNTILVGQTLRNDTGLTGFSVDLCKALAAAIFGSATEFVNFTVVSPNNHFVALNNGDVDVLASSTIHTMEREIYEGYSFSTPYLYGGLKFGGDPLYLACAKDLFKTNTTNTSSNFNNNGTSGVNCSDLQLCVLDSSPYEPIVMKLLPPGMTYRKAPDMVGLYTFFVKGICNVIAGNEFETAKATVESAGYTGAYDVGVNYYSKEPFAMVTRQDDGAWSDSVNWVIIGLLSAEERNLTKLNVRANVLARSVTAFGDPFQILSDPVAEVGNYGEIYSTNLEATIPRSPVNKIRAKNGTSGLIYSMPFGATDANGTEPVARSTLRMIRERGVRHCGIAQRPTFAILNETSNTWSGFDVDFCRALSAAIFNGATNTTLFTDLDYPHRFVALAQGDVDVLSRVTTITLERDVLEKDAKVGFSFSQPDFYDEVHFGGIPQYIDCAEAFNVVGQCGELRICVSNGTTTIDTVRHLFPPRYIVATASFYDAVQGLSTTKCNVVGGGLADVSTTTILGPGFYNGLFIQGTRRFSKDPLALVTRQDDPQWSAFVYWIVSAIFYAEEIGVTSATAHSDPAIPTVNLFSALYGDMFRHAIAAVGSYKEIYERHAEAESPRAGLNKLNTNPLQAQHYPPPGLDQ